MTITTPQMDNSTFTDNQTLTNRSFGDVVCLSELEPAVMTSHYMYLYVSMLFIGIGLIGNSLNIAVFSSKAMRKSSSNVYLLVLAVSDSLYLVSVFFTKILTTLRCMYFNDSQIDIVNRSEFMCKFLQYVLDFFSDFSTCLILAFTVERYVAVYAPIRFKQSCTVRKARIISAVIFTVITLFITPYHVMFMGLYRDYDVCIVLLAHEATFTILYVVEALVFRVVPVFVIVVLNVFIIVKVRRGLTECCCCCCSCCCCRCCSRLSLKSGVNLEIYDPETQPKQLRSSGINPRFVLIVKTNVGTSCF